MKSWIEVSERKLADNYRAAIEILKRESGHESSPALLAVVKANAYGHGAAICAPVLARAGAEWLGVTDAAEGAAVRRALAEAGIEGERQPQILVMSGHLAEDAPAIIEHRLAPVVWNRPQLAALAEAQAVGVVGVHLEIDTGMSRQGVAAGDDLRELLCWLRGQPRLRLDGVLTHFASAEVAGSEQTLAQRRRFEEALAMVAGEGLRPAWIHAGNTSVIDNGADLETLPWLAALAKTMEARMMVREGLGLYGYCLPLEGLPTNHGASRLSAFNQPVMTWKARAIGVTEVERGSRIGYNGTFVAERRVRLALLPVGYADGLRRELSCSTGNMGGWVMFHGRRAPIVGRISMNLTTVDVTDIGEIEVGDEVVLLGEGITAEEHAVLAGTISYEILCGIRAPAVLV